MSPEEYAASMLEGEHVIKLEEDELNALWEFVVDNRSEREGPLARASNKINFAMSNWGRSFKHHER